MVVYSVGLQMNFKKKEKKGIEERLGLLQRLFQKSKEIFNQGNVLFINKEVKADHIIML